MKKKLLVAVGLVFSATAFAQTGSVPQEHSTSVKVSAKSNAETRINGQHVSSTAISDLSGDARISSDKRANEPGLTNSIEAAAIAEKNLVVSSKANSKSKVASVKQETKATGNALVNGSVSRVAAFESVQAGTKAKISSGIKARRTNINSRLRGSASMGLNL